MEVVDVIDGVGYRRDEAPPCPLCGKSHPAKRIPAAFGMEAHVCECEGCAIAYQSPRPSEAASRA